MKSKSSRMTEYTRRLRRSGAVELTAGDHSIDVTFFQAASGLELQVEWQGPHIKKAAIPGNLLFTSAIPLLPLHSEQFVPDAQKVRHGRELFQTLGCAACHNLPNLKPGNSAKALAVA